MCTKKVQDKETMLQFDSYQACRSHYETVHGQHFNSKICDVCGLKFSKRVVLAQHRYNKHSIDPPEDIKLFRCEECDHMSVTLVCLEKHARKMHGKKVSEVDSIVDEKAKATADKTTKKPPTKKVAPVLKKSRLESVEVEEEEGNSDNGINSMEVGEEEEDDTASKESEDTSGSEEDEDADNSEPMTCAASSATPWQPAMSMYADACPIPALPNFQYSFTGNNGYNGASMPVFNGMAGPYMNPSDCQVSLIPVF